MSENVYDKIVFLFVVHSRLSRSNDTIGSGGEGCFNILMYVLHKLIDISIINSRFFWYQ